jgi:hypothetical protein
MAAIAFAIYTNQTRKRISYEAPNQIPYRLGASVSKSLKDG